MKSDEQKHLPWSLSLKTRRFLSLMTGIGNICILIAAIAALVQAHTLLQARADPYASCLYEKRLEAKQVLESDILGINLKMMAIFARCLDEGYLKELPLSLFETRITRPPNPKKLSFAQDDPLCDGLLDDISKYGNDLFKYLPILDRRTSGACLAFLNGTFLNFAAGVMNQEEREQFINQLKTFAANAGIDMNISQSKSDFLNPGQAIQNQITITKMVNKTFANQLGIETLDTTKILGSPNSNTFDEAIQEMVKSTN